jgi:hypothetical protein
MAAGDPNDPAIYGPVNGVFVTLSDFQAYEQSLVNANAQAAAPIIQQINKQYGVDIPVPVPSTPKPATLASFTGDCQQPNQPGFPGWASFSDAAAWANACTATPVTVPVIPAVSIGSTASGSAGRGAPAASAIAGGSGSSPQLQSHASGYDGYGGTGSYCDEFPDDPLCDIWGTGSGGGVIFGGGNTGGVYQPVIIQEGLNATDVHGIVDAGLDTVWSAVVGAIDATVLAAISAIQDAITALGNAIKAAFAMLARLGGFILNALASMLRSLLKSILQVLQDIRNVLQKIAKDILPAIAKAVKAIRDKTLDLYKRFVRPLLIWIQDVRRVLNILAIFHVPFAEKLDAKLADLERRITAPLLLLLRYTNQVANWMNLIVTANYLIQKPTFLWSQNAYKGESLNLFANAMNTPASAATIASAQAAFAAPSSKQTADDLTVFLQSDSGPYAVPIDSAGSTFDVFIATQG